MNVHHAPAISAGSFAVGIAYTPDGAPVLEVEVTDDQGQTVRIWAGSGWGLAAASVLESQAAEVETQALAIAAANAADPRPLLGLSRAELDRLIAQGNPDAIAEDGQRDGRPRPLPLDGCTCGGIGDTGAHRVGCQWSERQS